MFSSTNYRLARFIFKFTDVLASNSLLGAVCYKKGTSVQVYDFNYCYKKKVKEIAVLL